MTIMARSMRSAGINESCCLATARILRAFQMSCQLRCQFQSQTDDPPKLHPLLNLTPFDEADGAAGNSGASGDGITGAGPVIAATGGVDLRRAAEIGQPDDECRA